ncbi:MAG TPA: hypothetical protein VG015_00630 [Candidatus Dormibacteraeota bacterium]|nr:hypothetical protein [Candidatus Dormibacteraeota bacterium]
MCTEISPTQMMVCDVSRDRVRSELTATLGQAVTFETVHGEGTLFTCLDGDRGDEFRQVVEAAVAGA